LLNKPVGAIERLPLWQKNNCLWRKYPSAKRHPLEKFLYTIAFLPSIQSMNRKVLLLSAMLSVPPAFAADIDFTFADANMYTAVNEYLDIYGSFAESFSENYGEATAFTNHLTYPLGKDTMKRFPSVYMGFGMGTAFANTQAIKNDADPEVTSDVLPSILPTLAFSFNAGMGLTKKWDLRLSAVPMVDLAMPDIPGSTIDTSLRYGLFKLKATYHAIPGGLLLPGLSIGPYLSYSGGKIQIRQTGLTSTGHAFSEGAVTGTVDYSYDVYANASWNITGVGAEVRVWYDLMFIAPYLSWSPGFQGGSFSTEVGMNGTMNVNLTAPVAATETDTGSASITKKAVVNPFIQRIGVGFELDLFLVKAGVEMQVETVSKLAGLSFGFGIQF